MFIHSIFSFIWSGLLTNKLYLWSWCIWSPKYKMAGDSANMAGSPHLLHSYFGPGKIYYTKDHEA